MITVADSTPLISLSAISKLDLLKLIYGKIFIPTAVFDEVVSQGRGRSGAEDIAKASWIEPWGIKDLAQVNMLMAVLGRGESEVIVLAQELGANLVIMDEAAGRRASARRALQMIGTIGILQQAKLQKLIPLLKPELDLLLSHGFYISQRVYKTCLAQVGE